VLVPVLWLGIPALTSKSPFTAASLAERSPRELHGNKITGTFDRFSGLSATGVKLAALLATVAGAMRRDRAVLMLAGGVVLWVLTEAAFALHGWPAVARYMYEAAGGVSVLAGVFAGRVVLDSGPALRWLAARSGQARLRWLASPAAAAVASVVVLLAFAASLHGAARERLVFERHDLAGQRQRTHEILLLGQVIRRLGGPKIRACGMPNIDIAYQSILAWYLGTNTGILYFSQQAQDKHPQAVVNIYPHSYGWQVFPADTQLSRHPADCRGLTYST